MTKRPHFVQAQLHLVWNSPKFLLMVWMCNHCLVLTALKSGRILCIQIGTFAPPVHSVKSTKSENTHQTEHWRGHSYGSFILKSAFAWLCFVIHTFGGQARIMPPHTLSAFSVSDHLKPSWRKTSSISPLALTRLWPWCPNSSQLCLAELRKGNWGCHNGNLSPVKGLFVLQNQNL